MNTIDHRPVREWVLKTCEPGRFQSVVEEVGVHPIIAQVLYHRGITTPQLAEEFLRPTLAGSMYDPFLMKDMDKAVAEVLKAVERGLKIVIHGDYDVDGVCSVSVLYTFLRDLGAQVDWYIPKRDQDGYGVNIETVRRLQAEGAGLLITTDCGVSNVEEIRFARQLGMRVIVVDHHTIPPVLPNANAILNPLQTDCHFPFKSLAAVGVTFYFVVALRKELRERGVFRHVPEPDLRQFLDLVALGTIADVVPMIDQNRLFTRIGLEVLAQRRRPGVAALLEKARIDVGRVTARTVSFRIAPRINAAGRMDDASICVELMTTNSYARATKIAAQLENYNRMRQQEEQSILEEAIAEAERQCAQSRRILVVAGDGWHRGVLGIVASRLMERFHRPAILMGIDDGLAKGSARSIEGFNLIDALRRSSKHLSTFGGHQAAAGLSLEVDQLEGFRIAVEEAARWQLTQGNLPKPLLEIDSQTELGQLNEHFVESLLELAPFGPMNREPVLLSYGATASQIRVVGRRHLRAQFKDRSGSCDGFGFSMGDRVGELSNKPIALAFSPRYVRKGGKFLLQLQVKGVETNPDEVVREVEVHHESAS